MKQVHNMTPEELQKLLAFTTESGEVYFYSKIQRISKSSMLYDNIPFDLSKEQYKTIITGLNNYEAYKLSMLKQEAEELLKEKAETVLKDYYKDRLDSVLLPLETVTTTLIKEATVAFSSVDTAHSSLSRTTTSLSEYAKKVDKFVESTDLHTAELRLKQKVRELDEVKDRVLNTLQPVTKEASTILSTLKTIVSED